MSDTRPETESDELTTTFANFRTATLPTVKPTEYASIRATVQARGRRRLIGLCTLVAVAIAVPSVLFGLNRHSDDDVTAAPAPMVSHAPGVPCTAGDLHTSIVAGGEERGNWSVLLGFTNISATSCSLTGFPHVTASGRSPSVKGTDDPSGSLDPLSLSGPDMSGSPIVLLQPGGQAASEISSGEVDSTGGVCRSYPRLEVMVPGDSYTAKMSAFVPGGPDGVPVCGSFDVSSFHPRFDFPYSAQALVPSSAVPSSTATFPTACTTAQLQAKLSAEPSATQPVTAVALFNTTGTGCYLNGYVKVTEVLGDGKPRPSLTFRVSHSASATTPGTGPNPIQVGPGGVASFAISPTNLLDGPTPSRNSITLVLEMPGSAGTLDVDIAVPSAPTPTEIIQLSETAIVDGGSGPPPQ